MELAFVSKTSIFNPPPIVWEAYGVVVVAGVVLIGIALIEKYLAVSNYTYIAKVIYKTCKGVLPIALIAVLILFVWHNPLL
ncbi:hypothetical protein SAMN05192534_12466 [Alteribacillus persepolensis]|uniref:Uncharacterized protein n=1 Tax=Alteribacillus persepolensis TaxID=568899 RepID=A0A1G8IL55_9BACI|nr:hypothetical protein [Alteribacillus persepolensis]SDI19635.1 hypothetical protein SAMN05192534_12466 [Alteribacillus persepolensis]